MDGRPATSLNNFTRLLRESLSPRWPSAPLQPWDFSEMTQRVEGRSSFLVKRQKNNRPLYQMLTWCMTEDIDRGVRKLEKDTGKQQINGKKL